MKPRIPKILSKEAAQWWRKLQDEYDIRDEAGLLILQTLLEAYDRMKAAQKQIKAEGETLLDRFQQVKVHPLCAVERDSRSALMQGLKSLNLDFEPVRDIGRPVGG